MSSDTPSPRGLEAIAQIYIHLIDAGRSSNILAFGALAFVGDLFHSAGLAKDSMYARVGTFMDVAFTTGQIGAVLSSSAGALKTLAEAEKLSVDSVVDVLKMLPPGTLSKLAAMEAANAGEATG